MIEDKDWSRMVDLVLSGKDGNAAANAIKDKRKAIARFVCGCKLTNDRPAPCSWRNGFMNSFSEFGDKALSLGATVEEIQTIYDAIIIPQKYVDKMGVMAGKKLRDRFVGDFVKKVLDNGFDIEFLPHNGYAISYVGKAAMSRNGRKWTIGYKSEITLKDKKVKLIFDAITDEGDGPTSYVVCDESDNMFGNFSDYEKLGKQKFIKEIIETLILNK